MNKIFSLILSFLISLAFLMSFNYLSLKAGYEKNNPFSLGENYIQIALKEDEKFDDLLNIIPLELQEKVTIIADSDDPETISLYDPLGNYSQEQMLEGNLFTFDNFRKKDNVAIISMDFITDSNSIYTNQYGSFDIIGVTIPEHPLLIEKSVILNLSSLNKISKDTDIYIDINEPRLYQSLISSIKSSDIINTYITPSESFIDIIKIINFEDIYALIMSLNIIFIIIGYYIYLKNVFDRKDKYYKTILLLGQTKKNIFLKEIFTVILVSFISVLLSYFTYTYILHDFVNYFSRSKPILNISICIMVMFLQIMMNIFVYKNILKEED